MIKDWNVPDAGLEDLLVYANIRKSVIMKVSTHLELFPCSEVIGSILSREDINKMIFRMSVDKDLLPTT